jgi:hypothetical protein
MLELLMIVLVGCGIFLPPYARSWNIWAVMLGVGAATLFGLLNLMIYATKGEWLVDAMVFIVVATGGWFGIWGMAIQAVILARGPHHTWVTRGIGWGIMAVVSVLVLQRL